jgi:hypothetical protein
MLANNCLFQNIKAFVLIDFMTKSEEDSLFQKQQNNFLGTFSTVTHVIC